MNRMDCHPIRQKSMAKIFPSSEKYSFRCDLFISQAEVKDLQKSKGGEDWEIDSLPSEVVVSMLVCAFHMHPVCVLLESIVSEELLLLLLLLLHLMS
jgi:hypothetical protein